MKFGDILSELLEDKEMTQKELADRLSLSPSTVGNYIHNVREPDYETLKRIAQMLDVSMDYLLSHHAGKRTERQTANHREDQLLYIFRSLTDEQQEFYLEQGKIFLRQNKRSSEP